MKNNGYTEITINGRKAGLKFNMYAIEQFETIKGRNGNIKNFTTIIYAGILGNAYVKQIEPQFTFEEVSDWVEYLVLNGDPGGELNRVSEIFTNSQVLRTLIDKANKNGEPAEEQKKTIAETI
jgi:hypothetical protein